MISSFIENDTATIVIGVVLVMGVLVFAWFDYRRTSRLPHLGTVMVKNRLKAPIDGSWEDNSSILAPVLIIFEPPQSFRTNMPHKACGECTQGIFLQALSSWIFHFSRSIYPLFPSLPKDRGKGKTDPWNTCRNGLKNETWLQAKIGLGDDGEVVSKKRLRR